METELRWDITYFWIFTMSDLLYRKNFQLVFSILFLGLNMCAWRLGFLTNLLLSSAMPLLVVKEEQGKLLGGGGGGGWWLSFSLQVWMIIYIFFQII